MFLKVLNVIKNKDWDKYKENYPLHKNDLERAVVKYISDTEVLVDRNMLFSIIDNLINI